MPAIGWKVAGETYTYDEATAIASETGWFHGFPPAALKALRKNRVDGHWLSPSGAGGCPRQRVLLTLEDYHQDLVGEWSPGLGTAVHSWLEEGDGIRSSRDTHISEINLRAPLRVSLPDGEEIDFELRGTVDYYDIETQRAYDYKTVTDFDYWHNGLKKWVPRDLPSENHLIQANLYKYLLEANGMPVSEYWLWYARINKDAERRPYKVELWDNEDIYHTASNYAAPLAIYQKHGIIPKNRYDSKATPCRYCNLKDACRRLAKEGI